jgi:UDP-perosamine 4-acetyltransferase
MSGEEAAVVIYGAGGHGKVVLDALERSGRQVVGFADDDATRVGTQFCGYPVALLGSNAFGGAVEIVVAIGDGELRAVSTAKVMESGFGLAIAIHPSAAIGRDVEIGPGTMILAQAAVNPGARIGSGVIINTGATVDHDCVVGDFAHLAPGVRLAGNVRVGDRSLVGVGATIIPGIEIGTGATVGAGSVVVSNVADRVTVAGVPAKPVASGGRG